MPNVKIFQISEDSLHELGLALRNHNCVKIIILLSTETLPVSQIAKKLDIGVNIVSDQIKVLRELGLLKITKKSIVRKGNDHNFYEFTSDIFVSAIPEENKIKNIFKETVKFASVIVAGAVTYFSLIKEWVVDHTIWGGHMTYYRHLPDGTIVSNNEETIIVSLIVVIVGLLILYILEKIKKRK